MVTKMIKELCKILLEIFKGLGQIFWQMLKAIGKFLKSFIFGEKFFSKKNMLIFVPVLLFCVYETRIIYQEWVLFRNCDALQKEIKQGNVDTKKITEKALNLCKAEYSKMKDSNANVILIGDYTLLICMMLLFLFCSVTTAIGLYKKRKFKKMVKLLRL